MIALIDVKNRVNQSIDIVAPPKQEIEIEQYGGINVNPAPEYEGEYEVIPKVIEQKLPTANKLLTEDIKIKEIPYFETSNTSGGHTVFIGKEV